MPVFNFSFSSQSLNTTLGISGNAVSASYATTASYALNGGGTIDTSSLLSNDGGLITTDGNGDMTLRGIVFEPGAVQSDLYLDDSNNLACDLPTVFASTVQASSFTGDGSGLVFADVTNLLSDLDPYYLRNDAGAITTDGFGNLTAVSFTGDGTNIDLTNNQSTAPSLAAGALNDGFSNFFGFYGGNVQPQPGTNISISSEDGSTYFNDQGFTGDGTNIVLTFNTSTAQGFTAGAAIGVANGASFSDGELISYDPTGFYPTGIIYTDVIVNGQQMNFDSGMITSDGNGDLTIVSLTSEGINNGGSFTSDSDLLYTDGAGFLTVTSLSVQGEGTFQTINSDSRAISSDGSGYLTVYQLIAGAIESDSDIIHSDGNGNFVVGTLSSDAGQITTDGNGNLTVVGLISNGAMSFDSAEITSDGSGNITSRGLIVGANGLSAGGMLGLDSGHIISDGNGNLTAVSFTGDGSNLSLSGNTNILPAESIGTSEWLVLVDTTDFNGSIACTGINVTGEVVAISFNGDGSGLTNLDLSGAQPYSTTLTTFDSQEGMQLGNSNDDFLFNSVDSSDATGTSIDLRLNYITVASSLSSDFIGFNGDGSTLTFSNVPGDSTSTGNLGQIAVDSSYFYACTDTNTWKRVALSTW